MVIGIGIDLVEVKRIKPLIARKNIGRIFTAQEIKYCRSKKNPTESFAARFAAKEAFFKAIGTAKRQRSPAPAGGHAKQSPQWNEIEVRGCDLKLSGKARQIARRLGVKHIYLSLTHTKDYAMAVVILEKK